MRDPSSKIRVAAVGDLHCKEHDHGRFRAMVKQINELADLVLLCGDLTDHGLVVEGEVLAEELASLQKPCAAVLGNHDFDHGKQAEVASSLARVGVHVLNGDAFVFEKVLGVAGVKGFGGGFGRAALQAFGEPETKAFVQETVHEVLKLEAALTKLDTPKVAVIMHYAPIVGTLEGENPEIRPFMGSSRFAQALDPFEPLAVFHGHAHHGVFEGKTEHGVPVYNVAMPVVERRTPDRRFALIEL